MRSGVPSSWTWRSRRAALCRGGAALLLAGMAPICGAVPPVEQGEAAAVSGERAGHAAAGAAAQLAPGEGTGRPSDRAMPELSAEQLRTVAALRERQEQDLALLAKVCGELPDDLWIERLALDSASASIDGAAWTTEAVTALMEALDHTPGFGTPVLSAVRAAADDSQHFAITLARVAERAAAGSGEPTPATGVAEAERRALLGLIAPRGATPDLSVQIRSLLAEQDVKDFRLAPAAAGADPLELRSLSIRVARTRFEQVLDFLDELRGLPSLAVADKVELDGRGGRTGEISATLHLALPAWRDPG